jgi:quercetin dioxygenase-like cupin family protein
MNTQSDQAGSQPSILGRTRRRLLFASGVAVLSVIAVAGFVQATPGVGVTSTLFAVGAFDSLDAKTLTDIDPNPDVTKYWQARITTKGATDVHVLENRIAPGGTFGWHSHPGPSIVVVKSGALTVYLASDPTCTGRVVSAGSGFVDNGGDVHVVRNEGSVEAVVYVTSLVPRGFTRRIDEAAPAHCVGV